jgi:hypothetical protein
MKLSSPKSFRAWEMTVPEMEPEHRLSSLCAQRKKSGQHVRLAYRAEPYLPPAAAAFFDFFSAPLACSSSFFDLRAFFSAASSIS